MEIRASASRHPADDGWLVLMRKSIDLEIHLSTGTSRRNRPPGTGGKLHHHHGREGTQLVLPVKPGRNLAIIIEVAARNLSLKRMGYSAARELDKRLSDMMNQ